MLTATGAHKKSAIAEMTSNVVDWLRFCLKVLYNMPFAFKYRAETMSQMFILGNQALLLIIFASAFVSMALGIEWSYQLSRFGAKAMLGGVLSNAVLREIGPLVVGLLIAGRTSAEITSELGNMVLSEQIDALRAFGTDPVKRLVVSRVFASFIVMAPLVIIADAVGIIAGWIAAISWANIDSQYFWISVVDTLYVKDLLIGTVKPLVYGLFIGLISTYFGYTTKGGSKDIGIATTKAVRFASVSVLLLDFIITKIFHSF